MGNVENRNKMRQESNLCDPSVELHPQSAYWLSKTFQMRWNFWFSCHKKQLSVSLEGLELLVAWAIRQSLQSLGLVDFLFEPCNLRLNSVIGVVPWSQKGLVLTLRTSTFPVYSCIFHDPNILKTRYLPESMVGTWNKQSGQGTTSFPLSNPFPAGSASFWSNGPTPESCDLRWPHLTSSMVPCTPVPCTSVHPGYHVPVQLRKKTGANLLGLLLQQLQEVATLLLTSPGVGACNTSMNRSFISHEHDTSSSSARPSSWLCWFTWSNGSCDTPAMQYTKHSKHICQR